MKRIAILLVVAVVMLAVVVPAYAAPPPKCATIQSGTILDSAGNSISTGYDKWGYNYQARIFNGLYDNFSRPAVPVTSGDKLEMKWNDAWLSNQDCDGDQALDRHYGFTAYKGSGAWLTNHMSGKYEVDSKTYKWNYFVKIVAVPADATLTGGIWYTAGGTEIGPDIWGEFATIQEIYNDSGTGDHGILYKSPASPGLGKYKP